MQIKFFFKKKNLLSFGQNLVAMTLALLLFTQTVSPILIFADSQETAIKDNQAKEQEQTEKEPKEEEKEEIKQEPKEEEEKDKEKDKEKEEDSEDIKEEDQDNKNKDEETQESEEAKEDSSSDINDDDQEQVDEKNNEINQKDTGKTDKNDQQNQETDQNQDNDANNSLEEQEERDDNTPEDEEATEEEAIVEETDQKAKEEKEEEQNESQEKENQENQNTQNNDNNIQEENLNIFEKAKDFIKEKIKESKEKTPLFKEIGSRKVQTNEAVKEDFTYEYKNSGVKITFKSIDEAGTLTMGESDIKLNSNLSQKYKNISDIQAWEVTSSMKNGSFKYDLVLPNPYNTQDVIVIYTEDKGKTFDLISKANLSIKKDKVTIKGLDHFTDFIVLPIDLNGGPGTWQLGAVEGESNPVAEIASSPDGTFGDYNASLIKNNGEGVAYLGYQVSNNQPLCGSDGLQSLSFNAYTSESNLGSVDIYIEDSSDQRSIITWEPPFASGGWEPISIEASSTNFSLGQTIDDICSANPETTIVNGLNNQVGIVIRNGENDSPSLPNNPLFIDNVTIDINNDSNNYNFEDSSDPAISLTPVNDDFGDVLVNSSSSAREYTVESVGTTALRVKDITINDPDTTNNYSIDNNGGSNPCGEDALLDPDQTCTFTVTFSPLSTGTKDATVLVNSNDPNQNPATATVTGNGIISSVSPDIEVTPTTKDYGDVHLEESQEQIFTISNVGDGVLGVSNISINDIVYSIDLTKGSNPCNDASPSINPSESCTFGVTFTPNEEKSYPAIMTISSNDPDENPLEVILKGQGVNQAPNLPSNPTTTPQLQNTDYTNQNLQLQVTYSDPDNDTGYTNFRVSANHSSDCSTGMVFEGSSSTVNSGQNTNFETAFNLDGTDDATYYWCSQNVDEFGLTSDWLFIDNFILDTTAPVVEYEDVVVPEPLNGFLIGKPMPINQPENIISQNCVANGGELLEIPMYYESPQNPITYVCEFTDAAGNVATDTFTITITDLVPTVNITADPSNKETEPQTITLTANASGGNPGYTYQWSGDCAGDTQTIELSQPGTYDCTVTVYDSDTVAPEDRDFATDQVTVTIQAIDPDIDVTPTGRSFGQVKVGFEDSQAIFINNLGDDDLNIAQINLNDLENYTISNSEDCFNSIAPGDGRSFDVSFNPKATGDFPATIDILSNDPDEPTVTVILNGTGIDTIPPEVTFANLKVNEIIYSQNDLPDVSNPDNIQIASQSEEITELNCIYLEDLNYPINFEDSLASPFNGDNIPIPVGCTFKDLAGNQNFGVFYVEVLDLEPVVSINASSDIPVEDPETITLTAQPTGGNADPNLNEEYTYQWGGDCTGDTQSITVSSPGVYNCTVTVFDADKDQATANITVEITEDSTAPQAEFSDVYVDEIIASTADLPNLSNVAPTSQTEEIFSLSCTFPNGLTYPINHESDQNPIQVICSFVDANNNPGEANFFVRVNDLEPKVTISANPATTVSEGTIVTLTANPTGGNPDYSYAWGGNCSGTSQQATLPSQAGVYSCTVTIADTDGDIATAEQTVFVQSIERKPLLEMNYGNYYTDNREVHLDAYPPANFQPQYVMFSNKSDFSDGVWEPYDPKFTQICGSYKPCGREHHEKTWNLEGGREDLKAVYMKMKDINGNETLVDDNHIYLLDKDDSDDDDDDDDDDDKDDHDDEYYQTIYNQYQAYYKDDNNDYDSFTTDSNQNNSNDSRIDDPTNDGNTDATDTNENSDNQNGTDAEDQNRDDLTNGQDGESQGLTDGNNNFEDNREQLEEENQTKQATGSIFWPKNNWLKALVILIVLLAIIALYNLVKSRE